MEGCLEIFLHIRRAMEGCVGNIPAHQSYGGMCRKYSCTSGGLRRDVKEIFLHIGAMEGCVRNIPAHVYVSAMERCAKMFLH